MEFEVVVEIPKGQRNKYEMDHATGRIYLDRMLFTSTRYPADYGFIDGTLGQDGDPLDALVLVEEPTFPGCVVRSRAIGMFRMTDEKGPDDKIIAVPAHDPRLEHLQDLRHLPEFDRLEIQHFFEVYKALEPGKQVETATWVGRGDAEAEIDSCRERLAAAEGHQEGRLHHVPDDQRIDRTDPFHRRCASSSSWLRPARPGARAAHAAGLARELARLIVGRKNPPLARAQLSAARAPRRALGTARSPARPPHVRPK